MLKGWYCRTMKEEAHHQPSGQDSYLLDADNSEQMENENDSTGLEDNSEDDGSGNRNIDYKSKYRDLKGKVKILVYENVYFQNNLRASQRRLLKVTRDCSFLLDRLLVYERPELSSSDNDGTDSSDDSFKVEPTAKRRRTESPAVQSNAQAKHFSAQSKRNKKGPKKQQQLPNQTMIQERQPCSTPCRQVQSKLPPVHQQSTDLLPSTSNSSLTRTAQYDMVIQEGQLSKEEIERHLQSRQKLPEVFPEGELPTEMFNNSPSSDSNDHLDETAQNNGGQFFSVIDPNQMNV